MKTPGTITITIATQAVPAIPTWPANEFSRVLSRMVDRTLGYTVASAVRDTTYRVCSSMGPVKWLAYHTARESCHGIRHNEQKAVQ